MSKTNFQDVMLNELRKQKAPCDVYLITGYMYPNCRIIGFDNFTVVFISKPKEGSERQYMVYKHAISTITPVKQIDLNHTANDLAFK